MVNSILKATQILELFSAEKPRWSIKEISDALGFPKSTVHNILKTLASEGFVEQTDDDLYSVGTRVVMLTKKVRVNIEIRDRAAPLLRRLTDACRESVYLTVPQVDKVLYIYAIESSRRLRARSALGDLAHMHCTGVGKALLSTFSDEEIAALVARAGLPAFTEHTLIDLGALLSDMARTRRRGYSVDQQEHEIGHYCLGAPIYNHQRKAIAACSLSGVDPEIIGNRLPELSQLLLETTEDISRLMGYVPRRGALHT